MSGAQTGKPAVGKAVLLTIVGPGLGHFYASDRVRGAKMAVALFGLLVLAVLLSMLPPANLPMLLLMALPIVALPLALLLVAIDAARTAAGSEATDGSGELFLVGAVIWFAALATVAGLLYAVSSVKFIDIANDDMAPTLLNGESVAVWRDYYDGHLPERGDVAVVLLPGVEGPRVMRVIGLPGDSVLSVLGVLNLNGEAVERERLRDFSWRDEADEHRNAPLWRETLPDGTAYEILQSAGGILGGTLLGASLRIPDGSYFVIGDNRDETQSSWDFGFLPGEVLSDRPTVILGSPDRSRTGRSIQPD
jgi:signal peptidase I